MKSLENKIASVTGARRGIGRAVAERLARTGRLSWFTIPRPATAGVRRRVETTLAK